MVIIGDTLDTPKSSGAQILKVKIVLIQWMHGDTGIPRYQDLWEVQGLASELGRFTRKCLILVDTILIHGDNRRYA